jgi:hypothetical protein
VRLLALAVASTTVAQATDQIPPGLASWLNYGMLGVFTVLWLTGRIRRGADYDAVVAENHRLQQVFEERVLPALMKSNELLGRAVDKAGG